VPRRRGAFNKETGTRRYRMPKPRKHDAAGYGLGGRAMLMNGFCRCDVAAFGSP